MLQYTNSYYDRKLKSKVKNRRTFNSPNTTKNFLELLFYLIIPILLDLIYVKYFCFQNLLLQSNISNIVYYVMTKMTNLVIFYDNKTKQR
jgi:hypothetical protein